ncbi:tRNA threonylcarbamoyladenosine biosynthesis protein TsaE [Anaeroplasma bactoclasticum]|jgi:tRNA threonylcarbamoyladenosine biosynthesis protein TsaE|uniref:tRNA threonylcarbamoyladenosine biosynthesis protein TsaE n=1 Tax=Anaeroplasma bactoclasticum TaxID=2088 RepID=A0A397S0L5_9MOLU|nr:tRNA (adenosine(37)-N6)-threonylcarbamoyltransferase complex ATPase subunit type 1 TsaE [Anaeroplasma bactoclasticum]RIA78229.1 tRNA threonylcarbamoyladenosine biosynthesis protein TsaE [Anaeroplasma bactoclasticum]
MKSFKTNSALETIEIGKKIGALLNSGDVCLLVGDLSAGKTTITKGIGMALGVKKVINSPTFTIVKGYKGDKCPLYHLDLYRLDGVNNDFDLEEYMEGDGVCVIEWPFQVSEILPKEYLKINLTRTGEESRTIEVLGIGRYKALEEAL